MIWGGLGGHEGAMDNPASLLHHTYAYAAGAGAMLLVSAALLCRGVRGWRSVRCVAGDHPHCRRCGYDLYGLDATAGRCPECGADLAAHRVARAKPRWRWWVGMAAGALLLAGGAAASRKAMNMGLWAFAQKQNKPTSWVIAELAGADRTRAMWEIQRRLDADAFSPAQVDSLVSTIVDVQASSQSSEVWDWSKLVESLRSSGRVSDAVWRRYAASATELDAFDVRANVRRGEPVPFSFDFHARYHIPNDTNLSYTYYLKRVEVNGIPIPLEGTPLAHVGSPEPERSLGFRLFPEVCLLSPEVLAPLRLQDGPQRLRLVFDIDVYSGQRPSPGALPFVRHELTGEQSWTQVTPDAQTVEVVQDAGVGDMLARLIQPSKQLRCRADPAGGAFLASRIGVHHREMGVAISVWARANGREWLLGREAFHQVQPVVLRHAAHVDGFNADRVDLIVRADPDGARLTPKVTKIWGGEVVYRDVPVQWVDENANPTPRPATAPKP